MEISSRETKVIHVRSADQSEVGNARRQALALASQLDFSEIRCGELGIVVTEAARNLAIHGHGGEILLTPWKLGRISGLDVLALDLGTGIPDIAQALEDGFSTAGTPGTGLGAIERLSESFELYSPQGKGTSLLARMLSSAEMRVEQLPPFGSVQVPVGEETVSGDAWGAHYSDARNVYFMADGLGHGPLANEAAREAVAAFHANVHLSPSNILTAIHQALQKTRGAAIGIAEIGFGQGAVTFAGVGNISASLCCASKMRSMVSMNGTPGHNMGVVKEFTYPFEGDGLLIMHSDGLLTRWNLAEYPGLASRHPALIAGLLYRDFSRKRDDAAVLVVGL